MQSVANGTEEKRLFLLKPFQLPSSLVLIVWLLHMPTDFGGTRWWTCYLFNLPSVFSFLQTRFLLETFAVFFPRSSNGNVCGLLEVNWIKHLGNKRVLHIGWLHFLSIFQVHVSLLIVGFTHIIIFLALGGANHFWPTLTVYRSWQVPVYWRIYNMLSSNSVSQTMRGIVWAEACTLR